MLSVVLSATTITMNRGEQETLFRQSRNLRLLTEAQQQRQLLQIKQQQQLLQRHSFGNIHTLASPHMQTPSSVPCDDLVLSVLKSPLRDQSISVGGGGAGSIGDFGGSTNDHSTIPTPSPHADFSNLPNSEDELVDDIESALETTNLDSTKNSSSSPRALKFLRRFRTGRTSRFEIHHRRTPTPMRRKGRGKSKSRADTLDGVGHSEQTGKCVSNIKISFSNQRICI